MPTTQPISISSLNIPSWIGSDNLQVNLNTISHVITTTTPTTTIIFVIAPVQDIYYYVPETNHLCRVYSGAAVLYLSFVLHVMLFQILNMFCTFTLVLSLVCVQCPIRLLYVVSWFFPECYLGNVWMTMSWFQLLLLLLVQLLLSHSICTEFLL
jgi:hypothetical protein